MQSNLITAIEKHRIVKFIYDGGTRVVEPFAYGISHENKEVIRCWQVEGYSKSGSSQGWKLFEVAKIENLFMTEETFQPNRIGYRKGDSVMRYIICEI